MEQNGQKNFLDNFKNPNGSYHIPVWLIIVGFMFNWLLGLGLLIAHMSEDDSSKKTWEQLKAQTQESVENWNCAFQTL